MGIDWSFSKGSISTAMEAYSMDTSSPDCGQQLPAKGSRSPVLSLARLTSAIVIALLFISLLVYSLLAIQAQTSAMAELRAELTVMRGRVSRLETDCASKDYDSVAQDYDFVDADNKRPMDIHNNADAEKWEEEDVFDLDLVRNDADGEAPSRSLAKTFLAMFGFGSAAEEDYEQTDFADVKTSDGHESEEGDDWLHLSDYDQRPTEDYEKKKSGNLDFKLSTNRERPHSEFMDDEEGNEQMRKRDKRQAENQRGQRSRCQRLQECMPEAVFAHFEGDIDSASRIEPDRIHPHAWRMVNISASWITYWRFARWTKIEQRNNFHLNHTTGIVTVRERGHYFIYSQVQYFDSNHYVGHAIYVNGEAKFKCAECPVSERRKINTCYAAGLVSLHRDSEVGIRLVSPNRVVNLHHDSTYFGMYRVAPL